MSLFDKYNDVLSVDEACKALSMGKNSLYKLLQMGVIKSVKVGRKYYIPKVFLIDFINKYRYC